MLKARRLGVPAALAAGVLALSLVSGWSPLDGGDSTGTGDTTDVTQRSTGAAADKSSAPQLPGPSPASGTSEPAHTASPALNPEVPSSTEPVAPPSMVRIDAVGIKASVVPTDTDEHGVLGVPPPNKVGWFERWPAPGEPGPAVLAGHVDSRTGPGALFALVEVRPGMTIEIDRQDGSTATFLIERIETHAKALFPTRAVYGDVPTPQLRLITCTGPFDPVARQYRDNLVVFATAGSAN